MLKNRRRFYWLGLLSIVIISFIVKFNALNKFEAPPSPDYGNYLSQVDIIKGYDLRGLGPRYNPLFFLLLDMFLLFLDAFTALKLAASLVFSIAAIPFFLFVEKISKSQLAALVSTWFFVSFELYSEMIAWGGNPNFLGFSFMLLAFVFLVDSCENSSRRNTLLTGLFMSLAVGTHFLVAFFVLSSLLFFAILSLLLSHREKVSAIKPLLQSFFVAAILSLPYISVYLNFFKYSASGLVGFNVAGKLSEMQSGFAWIFRTQFLATAVIVVLGIFALAKYFKENRNNALILCTLFLTPLILALFTAHPRRWFYFLPIPMVACFGLYIRNLIMAIKNTRKILLLALCFILVIGVKTTVSSISHLEMAINYYQTIYGDEIEALRWIKENTEPSSIFATSGAAKFVGAGGNSYGWWIEGYSKRKSITAGNPEFFSYSYEREEVSIANRIFAGNYLFEYNNLRVSESFPSDMGNPEIAILTDGQYQNVLFLSDGEQELVFSPVENQQILWHEAPFYAKNKESIIYCNETLANATFTYEWSHLRVTRTLMMDLQQPSIDVIFEVLPINSTIKQFRINLRPSFYTSLENFEIRGSTISLFIRTPSNKIVEAKVSMIQTNGKLNETLLFKDPKYSMPVATYSLEPLQNILSVRIRISIAANNTNNGTMQFYNSYTLIKNLGIDYIFLNKLRVNEYHRFLSDSKHFKIVFQNETIAVFKVDMEENI